MGRSVTCERHKSRLSQIACLKLCDSKISLHAMQNLSLYITGIEHVSATHTFTQDTYKFLDVLRHPSSVLQTWERGQYIIISYLQFNTAAVKHWRWGDLGMRPVHSYLQFNTAAVKLWRWGDLGMRPVHSYIRFSTAAVKHWRWGDLGMRPVHYAIVNSHK